MGIFSIFNRAATNLNRVLGDVAPLVAAVAPIAVPGFGGFVAGALAQGFIEPGVVGARPVPVPMNPCQAPAFSAPFQASNFPSGGSPSGRELANFNSFQPRSAVGRQVVPRCPPSGTCPCPTTAAAAPMISDPRIAAAVQMQGLDPVQQAAVARFTNFQSASQTRFGRRI